MCGAEKLGAPGTSARHKPGVFSKRNDKFSSGYDKLALSVTSASHVTKPKAMYKVKVKQASGKKEKQRSHFDFPE